MKVPRYLISFNTSKLPIQQTDILIVGTGISGLRAAIESARLARRVTVITKDVLSESNTYYAQGGIACAPLWTSTGKQILSLDSSKLIYSHIQDTLQAGQGLNDLSMVKLIIKKGVEAVRELISWGVNFDVDPKKPTRFALAQEGGHSHPRILHCGDKTGQEIIKTLINKVRSLVNIEILEKVFTIDILTHSGRCLGVLVYNNQTGKISVIQAKKTILATGGCGQLYRETTNSSIATGDGLGMAYRAGAVLQDLEFVQFHPTALYVAGAARALISEAVRGAGGILRDKLGKRFMSEYHPAAELAPRDIVCRAILNQMRLTEDTNVYLDLTHLPFSEIKKRFPRLVELCQQFGINIARMYIPVRPSAHYMIGGIKINQDGSTNIENLLAAGEVVCSGFHGANRLGSNSLLEGLVTGKLAGYTAGKGLDRVPFEPLKIRYLRKVKSNKGINVEDVKNSLKSLMGRDLAIERSGEKMKAALKRINFWANYVLKTEFTDPRGWELQNLLIIAYLVTQFALKRQESRGTHYRTDYPTTDDLRWRKHILVKK